jgi:hypothetical protein
VGEHAGDDVGEEDRAEREQRAPRIEYVVIPAGSSSESPARRPGPATARKAGAPRRSR